MTGRVFLCLLTLILVAGTAEARFTDHLDDLDAAITARRGVLADDPEAAKAVKQLDKALRTLAKENLAKSYAKEVKAASKVAKILEKKLPEEAALHAELATALASYYADLEPARTVLAATAFTKKLQKLLKRVDKCFGKADLATTKAKELKKLAGAAKGLADWIGAEMPTEATWVVTKFRIADEGLDLDGDETPDNALKALLADAGQDGDALIASLMADAENVALIQMWGVDDWAGDVEVHAGIMNGTDLDGKAKDNFSGTEEFDVTAAVDVDGRPLVRETFELGTDGAYLATWTGQELELAGITLPASTVVVVDGTAAIGGTSGTIGVSIPVDLLLAQVVGDDPVAIAFAKLLYGKYFDLDGGDSISAAFTFETVPARAVTP